MIVTNSINNNNDNNNNSNIYIYIYIHTAVRINVSKLVTRHYPSARSRPTWSADRYMVLPSKTYIIYVIHIYIFIYIYIYIHTYICDIYSDIYIYIYIYVCSIYIYIYVHTLCYIVLLCVTLIVTLCYIVLRCRVTHRYIVLHMLLTGPQTGRLTRVEPKRSLFGDCRGGS